MAAVIRYHLHINPKELSEDDFYEAWGQVSYVLKKMNEPTKK